MSEQHPDPRADALDDLTRESEAQDLYRLTTPADPTPEQLAAAMSELRKPATFADLLDRNPDLLMAIVEHWQTMMVANPMKWDHARARLNDEAERSGLTWR